MSTVIPTQEETLPPLPALREDLRILEGPRTSGGEATWLLHDPLAHKFHKLAKRGFELLAAWKPMTPPDLLTRINKTADAPYEEQDIEDMAGFLYTQKLTIIPPGLKTEELSAQEDAASPPWSSQIFHKYLFFRIPLFKPQKFLRAAYPFIAPLYSKLFRAIIIVMGVLGAWFALEQWDNFKSTFLHFLTFEGMLYYGLTLILLKTIHELGHAFMSHRFGCKVPVIGLAFLVMFPILYTDTTDAWRLTDRRKRVLIDAGGMLAELSIACIALFAWSFLPDGPMRSMAFFAATTSWGLSLLVNLNPMMRFDGYYLLSDFFEQPNLRERSFALGKWKMRESLFKLGHDCPHIGSKQERFWMLVYAYATWVYLFFLFIGIAVLVHALFPKALGILLFTVEILFFIIKPIMTEALIWWRLRMDIIKTKRSGLSLFFLLCLGLILFVPWQTKVKAPALLQPIVQTQLHVNQAGRVEEILVKEGEHVSRGQVLVRLSSDILIHDKDKAALRAKLINAQLSRRASDRQDLSASAVLKQALRKEQASYQGAIALERSLEIRAPHSGTVRELHPNLHIGRYINPEFTIARIINPNANEILSFVRETDIARIGPNAMVKFIADDILSPSIEGQINFIAQASEEYLTEPIFSSDYRGPIAVKQTQSGGSKPVRAIIRLKAAPINTANITRAKRGIVVIKAKRRSPAKAIWRRIAHVLIRETDF